jgi:hypothetical protein
MTTKRRLRRKHLVAGVAIELRFGMFPHVLGQFSAQLEARVAKEALVRFCQLAQTRSLVLIQAPSPRKLCRALWTNFGVGVVSLM